MTTTHGSRLHPARLRELLDPTIRKALDRLHVRSGQRVLEIGAGTGEITARLARDVGLLGTVAAVDKDISYLDPTSVIDVYHRDLDVDALPGEPDSFDFVVARWLHGPLRYPTKVLEQLINRLRPGGWLILADVTSATPRIFRATADDTRLIHTVTRGLYHAIAGADGGATWTAGIDNRLLGAGMVQVCTHTCTETWTGGGPGCELLATVVEGLRPFLISPDVTDADLDHFVDLMADPAVVLGSYQCRAVHARKAG
ncbi:class I SAM-dependent methyltransferase [Micromonospora sp. LOL_025]|uniref:class I SAM-dependent methyltransferase n=1 Tax=Micromonospora sp. LOL_025 TaxID=3345413 RepID=UPI003A89AA85